jgi:hypothetical protein
MNCIINKMERIFKIETVSTKNKDHKEKDV